MIKKKLSVPISSYYYHFLAVRGVNSSSAIALYDVRGEECRNLLAYIPPLKISFSFFNKNLDLK